MSRGPVGDSSRSSIGSFDSRPVRWGPLAATPEGFKGGALDELELELDELELELEDEHEPLEPIVELGPKGSRVKVFELEDMFTRPEI